MTSSRRSETSEERFVDYLAVVGLDVSSGLEPDIHSVDSLHDAPLIRPYKSATLSHYPDMVPGNPFDKTAVAMLCLPNGLHFYTQRDSMSPVFHSFVITKEDGTKLFGTCFTFHEIVTNRNILMAMQTLQSMHLAEVENDQSRTLYAHIPATNVRQRTLERNKQSKQVNVYAYDSTRDTLFVTKCICLLSQINYVDCFKHWCEQLYAMICRTDSPPLALECHVYNLLYEVPCPKVGECMVFRGCLSEAIYCRRPDNGEFPLCDYSLGELFMLLGIENVLLVFSCLLLEHQILLRSSSCQRLMLVAEGINCLVYPFSWQHVYVPILPSSSQHFLDAPVPFIMGMSVRSGASQSPLDHANLCFVDIDNKTVQVPEDIAQFPNLEEIREEVTEVFVKFSLPSDRHQESLDNAQSRSLGRRRSSGDGKGSLPRNGASRARRDKLTILQQSEALQRVTAIAKNTGVITTLSDLTGETDNGSSNNNDSQSSNLSSSQTSSLLKEMTFNVALREIFLRHFVYLFSSYEAFIVNTSHDMESWVTNRDSTQNFDKSAFLSDQPAAHVAFLSAFLETQMFTSFIDNKILSTWTEPDNALQLFETRVKHAKEQEHDFKSRTKSKRLLSPGASGAMLEKALNHVDVTAPEAHPLELLPGPVMHNPGFLPKLNSRVLNEQPVQDRTPTRRKREDRSRQHLQSDQSYIQEARLKAKRRQPKLSDMSPGAVSETNWKFVETLLKETKAKTKRMVVDKMGQEAVELGHYEVSLTSVEETTLIAGLCDLLERIWSHGMQHKQGKSALWVHLTRYQSKFVKHREASRELDSRTLTRIGGLKIDTEQGSLPRRQLQKRPGTVDRRSRSRDDGTLLKPIPKSVLNDLKNVQKMADLKTEIGFARAFVRLSLEKKVLCTHLQEILKDTELLKSMYKRYAFLRCEDEREQLMFHLLALNAVDYHSFTNAFVKTMMTYRVVIHGMKKFSVSSAPRVWIQLSGTHRDTGMIRIPENAVEFTFQHKNLGNLTTLRVGHEDAMSLRWTVEFILVRNEITGHTYKFPCGRWLGRGVDDGGTERLLMAEQLPSHEAVRARDESEWTGSLPRHFIRTRSPSASRRNSEHQILTVSDIQAMLGDSVNCIVKHFHRPEKERGSLTLLLCGEAGLVNSMKKMFQYGFKSARLFRNDYYIWDYLEKVQIHIETMLEDPETEHLDPAKEQLCKTLSSVISKISNSAINVGKDGKFQTFVCIGVRDHVLAGWLAVMADTPVTRTMYEDSSFLRNPQLLTFVIHILGALKGFHSQLEPSITRGFDV